MMVKVLLYAHATGTFSSRRIARKLEEDVAYRVLAAGNFPAHRTICEFRQEHLKAFGELFVQVVRIAREAGWCGWARRWWTGRRSRPTGSSSGCRRLRELVAQTDDDGAGPCVPQY